MPLNILQQKGLPRRELRMQRRRGRESAQTTPQAQTRPPQPPQQPQPMRQKRALPPPPPPPLLQPLAHSPAQPLAQHRARRATHCPCLAKAEARRQRH